jgi:hypothetical protein
MSRPLNPPCCAKAFRDAKADESKRIKIRQVWEGPEITGVFMKTDIHVELTKVIYQ